MEIERKFLIQKMPEHPEQYKSHLIEQAYLNVRPVVRVRREDENYYMTYKGGGMMAREEYNLPLDADSYAHLLQKADGNIITKRRYLIPFHAYTIELDVFEGLFEGIVVAEVEFPSIEEAESLINNTNIGSEVGQISQDNKDKLQFIIDEAKDLTNKKSANYKDISNIKDKIESAIIEFEDNIIKPVDKSKLESAISKANNLYNSAVEGSQKGQYKSGSKSSLMNAITQAKKIYNSSSIRQNEVNSAVSTLNNAINSFQNKKITQSDRNSDGSYTREYVQAYLNRTETDATLVVMDATEDKIYNNELCYLVGGHTKETNAAGFTYPIEYYIGSKTLEIYSYNEVGW